MKRPISFVDEYIFRWSGHMPYTNHVYLYATQACVYIRSTCRFYVTFTNNYTEDRSLVSISAQNIVAFSGDRIQSSMMPNGRQRITIYSLWPRSQSQYQSIKHKQTPYKLLKDAYLLLNLNATSANFFVREFVK